MLLIFTFVGCGGTYPKFSAYDSFNNGVWESGKTSDFFYINKEKSSGSDIILLVNHAVEDSDITITFEIISPSKKLWKRDYTFHLSNDMSSYSNESKSELRLVTGAQFDDLGGYKIKVTNATPNDVAKVNLIGIVIK